MACSAPFPSWLWLNGHEWAKRQLEIAGIVYEALDNGFRSCSDAATLQKICDRLGPSAVQSFSGDGGDACPRRLARPISITGRPSIPPEKLLRAQLIQMLYSVV
jgi:hypothetical protein